MMRMRIGATLRKTQAMLLAIGLLAAPTLSWAGADAYYERAFVVAANQRCNLFRPELASALTGALG